MNHSREKSGQKVLVALGGGIESAVTAELLKNQGHHVVGLHLRMGDHSVTSPDHFGSHCQAPVDMKWLKAFCAKLDMPLHVVDATEIFEDQVVDFTVHEILQNRIPNPCLACTNRVKFDFLFQNADSLGCQWVATGHRAQVIQDLATGVARLLKSVTPETDQSHLLFGVPQERLQRLMTPLGGIPESMIQRLAREFEIPETLRRICPQSCFVKDPASLDFIANRSPLSLRAKGIVRSIDGHIVGEHFGIHQFHIGQNLEGLPRSRIQMTLKDPENYWVLAFELDNHVLVVGGEKHLFHRELVASGGNWVKPMDGLRNLRCRAKIGADPSEIPCVVTQFELGSLHVTLEESVRALTPGQAIVFYDGGDVLGGAFIDRVKPMKV